MKQFYCTILLLIGFYTQAQNIKEKATILLNPDFKKGITVFADSTLLKSKGVIKNNIADEDFIYFEVEKVTERAYYVNVSYFIDGEILKGWIDKKNPLGIYLKGYNSKISIFRLPLFKSEKLAILKEYRPDFIKVLDCKIDWLLLQININNKIIKGWVYKDYLCDNPYTTCN
ncbi:hypothetical protein ACG2LH_12355 [Zhouia sp. PK063]|uniref:hypothetical protein n=1 Tax=Zhouia sp. PK063 TaxID=3373602 RepID=UPI00379081EE